MGCVCRVGEFWAFWARFARLRGVGRRVCAARGARARLEVGGGAKKGGRASPRPNPFGGRARGRGGRRARRWSGCGVWSGGGRRARAVSLAVAACGRAEVVGRGRQALRLRGRGSARCGRGLC